MVEPSSWDEIVALAKGEGKNINLAEKRWMAKVAKLVKERGHHVVDAVGAEGVEAVLLIQWSVRPVAVRQRKRHKWNGS